MQVANGAQLEVREFSMFLGIGPHSREVWYRSGSRPNRSFFTQPSVTDWIREHVKGNRECLFLAGLWWIWCWRNNMVFGDASWDVNQVLRRVFTSA